MRLQAQCLPNQPPKQPLQAKKVINNISSQLLVSGLASLDFYEASNFYVSAQALNILQPLLQLLPQLHFF